MIENKDYRLKLNFVNYSILKIYSHFLRKLNKLKF
jgi:hypothetical protein